MFDGIYFLISYRAIEVFPLGATLFAQPPPPPPQQSTSISTREKILTYDSRPLLNNNETSVDDILGTKVETTCIPCYLRGVICRPISLYIFYAFTGML